MKWLLRSLFVTVAGLALACNESVSTSFANLEGTQDMALSGDLLFVAATDEDELRVADLTLPDPDWVPAPNPLHPLSVPVVPRPSAVVADVNWADGSARSGQYVFVRSGDARAISVVDARREALKEVRRIEVSAQITAMAARARPDGTGASTLFVATFDGVEAVLHSVELPAPAELTADTPLAPVELTTEPCAVILALQVMPTDDLAWSIRRTSEDAAACAGASSDDAVLFDVDSGARTALDFGAPVRMLLTNPAFQLGEDAHPAGLYVYGVLDEGSCAPGACRGLIAVVGPAAEQTDAAVFPPASASAGCGTAVGDRACDVTGHAMIPIEARAPLIMGAAVGTALPGLPVANTPTGLVGLVATSDGELTFFDAYNLRVFDLGGENGANLPATVRAIEMLDARGVRFDAVVEGPKNVEVADGAARDEDVFIGYRGFFPDFRDLSLGTSEVSTVSLQANPAGIVEVGDELAPVPAQGCTDDTARAVTAVDGAGRSVTVDAFTPVAGCTYGIRPSATSAHPWVIAGTSSGFLGRVEADGSRVSTRALDFYYHADGFQPDKPLLGFDFASPFGTEALSGLSEAERIGVTYKLVVEDNFVVGRSRVRASVGSFAPSVPSTVLFRPGTSQILIAYPSDEVVVPFDASGIIVGQNISTYQRLLR